MSVSEPGLFEVGRAMAASELRPDFASWGRDIADAMADNEHGTLSELAMPDHGMADDLSQTPESIEQEPEMEP